MRPDQRDTMVNALIKGALTLYLQETRVYAKYKTRLDLNELLSSEEITIMPTWAESETWVEQEARSPQQPCTRWSNC